MYVHEYRCSIEDCMHIQLSCKKSHSDRFVYDADVAVDDGAAAGKLI